MADTEQLVLSISADVRQMQRALDRMVKDTATSTKAVEQQFGSMSSKVEGTAKSFNVVSLAAARQGQVLKQIDRRARCCRPEPALSTERHRHQSGVRLVAIHRDVAAAKRR